MYNKPKDRGPRINQTGPYPKTTGRDKYRHIVTMSPKILWPSWRASQRRAGFEGQICQMKKDKDIAGSIQQVQRQSRVEEYEGGIIQCSKEFKWMGREWVTNVTWN